jgi:hypothetical protein
MYRILSWSDLYSGKWLVIRVSDLRIMTSGSVHDCLRWVKVWGPVDQRAGSKLSDRATLP